MAGISNGYVYAVTEKFALEAFVGGGTIQSFYKGYDITTGLRYEDPDKFNKSGELVAVAWRVEFDLENLD